MSVHRQIRSQFLSEAVLFSLLGGAAGIAAGVLANAIYASRKQWDIVIPTLAGAGRLGAAAGLLTAPAPRMAPTEALRTV